MRSAVLDASALLAYFQDEPGAALVEEALGVGAVISAANWAEVLSKLGDAGVDPAVFVRDLDKRGFLGGNLHIEHVDVEAALEIALLPRAARAAGLSLADRACLALAARFGLPALTTDAAWTRVKTAVEVRLIR